MKKLSFDRDLLKNRTVLGLICILFSLLICFGVTPLMNSAIREQSEIVRVKTDIAVGTQITGSMLETVTVGSYNLPADVLKNKENVIGKYALAELQKGDYILSGKLAHQPLTDSPYLEDLDGTESAISVTIPSFAAGLSARKATHTWLAGKIKCGNCGYALMSIINRVGRQYLRCTKRLDNKSCAGCGKIYTAELEALVYQQMVKKLESYKTLTGRKKAAKENPKITALQVELARVDSEIEKLVDSLTGANNVLLSYVNVKIAELDGRKQALVKEIAELTVETISPEQVKQISGYLDTWDSVSFDDKRRVLDLLVVTVEATSDRLNITWKI